MRKTVTTGALLGLFLSSAFASAADGDFRARGNEPFWSLDITADAIVFTPMDGEVLTVAPLPTAAQSEAGGTVYEGTAAGAPLVVAIADAVCTDTMSGMPFPNTVRVTVGTETLTVCGGEPVSLLLGAWQVTEIGGASVVADSEPSIAFEEGGAVNGSASCNRFFGTYTLSGEGLSIGDVGSSMMMCEDPVMANERTFLEILDDLGGFEIGADGALTLRANDGRTIVATKAG